MDIIRIQDAHEAGLFALIAGFLEEIGEPALDESGMARIDKAVAEDRIRFFGAVRDGTLVGCCSLTMGYSTFGGGAPFGLLEDFFVAEEFRKKGVARALVERALAEAESEKCSSVILGCSEEDVPMYDALGFTERIGTMLSRVLPKE